MHDRFIQKTKRGFFLPFLCFLLLGICSAFQGIVAPNTHAVAPSGSWVIVESPNGDTAITILSGITKDTNGHLWAVGDPAYSGGNKTIIIEWDGTQWKVTPSPHIGPREQQLNSITCDTNGQLWAVGMNTSPDGFGKTLVERWDGAQWVIIPSPNVDTKIASSNALMSITPDKDGSLWAVGDYMPFLGGGSRTLVEKWDGTHWAIIPSPSVEGSPNNILNSVTSDQSGQVWAVGEYESNPIFSVFKTLIEVWDGSTWKIVTGPNPGAQLNWLLGVTSDQSGRVWAVGVYGSDGEAQKTLIEAWDGGTWSVVSSPSLGSGESVLRSVTSDQSGQVWTVGEYSDRTDYVSHPFVLKWDGSSWNTVFLPPHHGISARLYGVIALSENNVWIVGTYYNDESRYQTMVGHYGDALPSPTLSPSPTATVTPTPSVSPTPTLPASPTPSPSPTPTPAPKPTARMFENFNSGANGWVLKGKIRIQKDHGGNGLLVYTPKNEAIAYKMVNSRALAGFRRITLRLKLNGGRLGASSNLFLTQGGKKFSVSLKVTQGLKTWQTVTVLLKDAKGFTPSQPFGQLGLDVEGIGPSLSWDDITFVP